MLGQSKTGSVIEAVVNIGAGCGVAYVSQVVIFSFYDITVPFALNVKLTIWFTAVSLARSFVIRRVFNRITYRA